MQTSPRRLAGWEPSVHVEYLFDSHGEKVGEVHRPEPEWSDRDRAWMLALAQVEADRCPGCGLPHSETTDPDARYDASNPSVCHGCEAIADTAHQMADAYQDIPTSVYRYRPRKV